MTTTDISAVRSALDADYHWLSAAERRIFDRLLRHVGEWVPNVALARMLYAGYSSPAERHCVRVHIARMRRRLREHAAPWRIDTAKGSHLGSGSYRLSIAADADAA